MVIMMKVWVVLEMVVLVRIIEKLGGDVGRDDGNTAWVCVDIFGGDGGYDGVMDMVMIVVLCTGTYQHQECWRCIAHSTL